MKVSLIKEYPVQGAFVALVSLVLTLFLYLNNYGFVSFAVLGIGGGVAILLWPQGGLYILAVSLPFSGISFKIPGVATTPKLITLVILIGLLIRIKQISLRDTFDSKSIRVLIIMVMICVLELPFSSHLEAGIEVFFIQLRMLLLVIIVNILLKDMSRYKRFSLVFFTGAVIYVSLVLIKGPQWVASMQEQSTRLSTGMNPNQLAEIFGIAFGSSVLYLALNRGKPLLTQVPAYISAALCVIGIILTQSRAGILGLAIFLLVITYYSMKDRKIRAKTRGVIFIMITLISASTFLYRQNTWNIEKDLSERLERAVGGFKGESDPGSRIDVIWPEKIAEFEKNILVGGGPGLDRAEKSSHNDILYQLSNFGIFGFALFLLLMISLWKEASSPKNEHVRVAMKGMLLFIIAVGITHTTILHVSYGMVIALISRYRTIELGEESKIKNWERQKGVKAFGMSSTPGTIRDYTR